MGSIIVSVLAFLASALLATPADRLVTEPIGSVFDPVAARAEHFAPGEPRELSKKEEWIREKTLRPDVHLSDAELSRTVESQQKLAKVAAKAAKSSKGKQDATARKAVRDELV